MTDVRVYLRRLPGRRHAVVRRRSATRRRAIAAHPAFAGWPLIVVSDEPARATRSDMNFLWTTFTRFEPAADIHAASSAWCGITSPTSRPIVIDARMKPWYPKEVTCDPDTAATVTDRWKEYFPSGTCRDGRLRARPSGLSQARKPVGLRPEA